MARGGASINLTIYSSLCCILIGFPTISHAARILGYFSSTSKSHLLIHCSIADTLARAGHDVTVIGGTPNVLKNSKYKYIYLETNNPYDENIIKDVVNKPEPIIQSFPKLINRVTIAANESISHPKMQKFLREHGEGSFDLVIIGYLMNEFHFGLGGHFKCPIAVSFMIRLMYPLNALIGNPNEYSYVPTVFSELKQPLTFLDRVKNYMSGIVDQYLFSSIITYNTNRLYDLHFPPSRYPSFNEVMKNVSIVFSNHHSQSQGPIRPNVPALIEIGGIQIKEKSDPLPEDIASILDNSKEGVIYFSLGSNVQGNILTESIAQAMFNVLSKLPYKVLWKWGETDFPGTSANIIYKSWLPQDDILAHPNIKLFITHAGLGSVLESQYHGVPMVTIPLFLDQPANAANVEQSGYGLKLDYVTLTEDSFRNGILEVLNNPKYSQTVKQFSKLYRDRPMTPQQLVIYWTEYVMRHNGAKNIQSPAIFLNQLQLSSWDVIVFLVAIVATIIFMIVKCCKFLFCRKTKKSDYHRVSTKKVN